MSEFSLVRGRVMRVTALDGCGRPKTGACVSIASKGFISIGLTAQTETSDDISVTNAAGEICVSDKSSPQLTGYAAEIQFCKVNPELYAMLTGQAAVYDADGEPVGFRVNSDVSASDSGFALESWSNVPGQACGTEGAAGSFGYTLLPFLQGGIIGDFTIENAAVTFTVTGAQTKTGSGWDVGPYDVVPGVGGTAGPLLSPIKSGDHLHVQMTSVAPPEPGDCQPSGVAATGATAGTPGTLTPADSYPPATFADLTASPLTADPTTAWTTGQYIVLGDASKAHWDGTAWVAGVA
jgi:hypothetical protein